MENLMDTLQYRATALCMSDWRAGMLFSLLVYLSWFTFATYYELCDEWRKAVFFKTAKISKQTNFHWSDVQSMQIADQYT